METILVLTDFSERAERAARFAVDLACWKKADVLIYHSVILLEPFNPGISGPELSRELAKKEAQARKSLHDLADRLGSMPHAASPVTIRVEHGLGPVPQTIERLITENQVLLVVMGNHPTGANGHNLSDSNVGAVTQHAGCPVILIP